MSRSYAKTRNWCFTYFGNQKHAFDLDKKFIPNEPKIMDDKKIKYLCYQLEKCPRTGAFHYQGYFQTTYAVARPAMYDWLDCVNAHYEKANGTPEENKNYCSKKDTAIPGTFKEFGSLITQGQRNDLKNAVNAPSLHNIPEETLVRYGRGIMFTRSLLAKPRDFKTEVHCIWGPTGVGKSRMMPIANAYWKMNNCIWWDGYDNEDNVVLDDWKENTFDREYMLRLCDQYPLRVQIKGGSMNFNAKKIYITSNDDPSKWYNSDQAWIRRITSCTELKLKSEKDILEEKYKENSLKLFEHYKATKIGLDEERLKKVEEEYQLAKGKLTDEFYAKMQEIEDKQKK